MNRNQLMIVLDSSVSQKNISRVGPALCFWIAYIYNPTQDSHPLSKKLNLEERYINAILMEASKPKSIRSGMIYNSVDGPTKIFYDGIIRSLESCFYLLKKEGVSEVTVLGDCEHAINQLNGNVRVKKMKPLYNQVEKLKNDYRTNGASISFLYIEEENYPLYKKIDSITKEMRNKISKVFNKIQ